MTRPFGLSQKMATQPCSPSMSATIPRINTATGAGENSLLDPGKKSSCEQKEAQPDLFGVISSTEAGSKESIVPFSVTKAKSYRQTLSDRLTPSLISSGLVAGITPTSTRRRCGAGIPDIASFGLDGRGAGKQKEGYSYLPNETISFSQANKPEVN